MNPEEQELVNNAIVILIDKARDLETMAERASV